MVNKQEIYDARTRGTSIVLMILDSMPSWSVDKIMLWFRWVKLTLTEWNGILILFYMHLEDFRIVVAFCNTLALFICFMDCKGQNLSSTKPSLKSACENSILAQFSFRIGFLITDTCTEIHDIIRRELCPRLFQNLPSIMFSVLDANLLGESVWS